MTAATVVGILGLGGADATTLTANVQSGRPYIILAHELTPDQSEAIRTASTPTATTKATAFGLILEPEELRQMIERDLKRGGRVDSGELPACLLADVAQHLA